MDSKKAALFLLMLTAFLAAFSGSALNLSIPAIDRELEAGATAIGWIINGYIIAGAALSVPIGRLADITNRVTVLKIGLLIFSLTSGVICLSSSIGFFLVFRILQGVGGAMIFATNQAVLISIYPKAERGKAIGFIIGATYVGLTTGPVVGGIMNQALGWRSILIFTLLIGLVNFVLAMAFLRPVRRERQVEEKADIVGSLMFIALVFLAMYGLSSLSQHSFAKYMLLGSFALLFVFIRYELRLDSPLIQVRLFKSNINYLLSNLAALLNYGATFAVGYLMSIFLQVVKGMESGSAGLIMITQPLLMALLSPYMGRLSDRVSPYKLASLGMGFCAIALFLLAFIKGDSSILRIVLNLSLVGVGFALFSSPNTNAIMACVEPKDYGVASSLLATMRNLGQSSNMAVVTFIISIYIGKVPLNQADPVDILQVMKVSYGLFTVLCIIGAVLSMNRKKPVLEKVS